MGIEVNGKKVTFSKEFSFRYNFILSPMVKHEFEKGAFQGTVINNKLLVIIFIIVLTTWPRSTSCALTQRFKNIAMYK